jgi:hypothetical protein
MSFFLATGKRFSVDCKIYGGRDVCNGAKTSYTYESNVFSNSTLDDVITDVIPGVIAIAMLSNDPKDREAAFHLHQSLIFSTRISEEPENSNRIPGSPGVRISTREIVRRALLCDLVRFGLMVNDPS